MSLTISINDINNLTDTERAVLRLIAGNEASVADDLKATVRGMASSTIIHNADGDASNNALDNLVETVQLHHTNEDVALLESQGASAAPTAYTNFGDFNDAQKAFAPKVELDANGLPWDKRIHASTRTKVAAGTWKYARGVDKDTIAIVEAELRAVQAIPAPTTTSGRDTPAFGDAQSSSAAAVQPAGWPFAANVTQPVVLTSHAPSQALQSGQVEVKREGDELTVTMHNAPPADPSVPLPPTATATTLTFAEMMRLHVTPHLVSGKLTQAMLQSAAEKCGLPHLAALGARPDLVETVKAAIEAEMGGVE